MQTGYSYKKIEDAGDIKGKKILLRLDLNVPLDGNDVVDDFRIQSILPTLGFFKDRGAKTIIISHIENDEGNTLLPVSKYLEGYFSHKFVRGLDYLPDAVNEMLDGEMIMLENLRKNAGEKENKDDFSKRLAGFADIYVNEAFSVSHREHASIVGLPKILPSYAGPLLDKEISSLSESFNPPKPFLFILGGAKFNTKIPLVKKFLNIADYLFVCGALSNDIYRHRGYEVGKSVVSRSVLDIGDVENNKKLIVPEDVVVRSESGTDRVCLPDSIKPDEAVMDAGPETIAVISDLLSEVKCVLWNGPLGNYEEGYSKATESVARAISASAVKSIVGGGDTVAVLNKLGILDNFSFVSTGGGAMLDFLANGTLPGIEALGNQ